MFLRIYVFLWIAFAGFFSYEYYALNTGSAQSILKFLETSGKLSTKISADPGRPLSLWLGWIGLILMIVMNVYSMRKRFQFMNSWGSLANWLDFHIFCGLLGPTFILFHCNFKVRGLVGISFWSMVISFSSGIIGRYFYLQLASKKNDFEEIAARWKRRLQRHIEKAKVSWDEAEAESYIGQALVYVGFAGGASVPNPFWALAKSTFGDVRLMFSNPTKPPQWPDISAKILREHALSLRRAAFLESFQKLMGYWHAFHFPFAIFMYVAAVIHVTAALVLGV
jgi:hypothetical protein